jgi:hypothetical protein
MRKSNISQAGAKTNALLQGQMRPIHRVFWVDGDPNVYHRNAEILIRHDFEVNSAQDGKIAWSRPASTVRSTVRCD